MLTAEHYLDSLLVSVKGIENRYGKSKIMFCLFYISDKIIQIIEIYFHSEIRWLSSVYTSIHHILQMQAKVPFIVNYKMTSVLVQCCPKIIPLPLPQKEINYSYLSFRKKLLTEKNENGLEPTRPKMVEDLNSSRPWASLHAHCNILTC